MLRFALLLLLFSIEACKRISIVWQFLIRNEDNARVLHALYLLGSKTEHGSKLAQVVHIRLVCTVLCCNLARHSAVITAQHNAVLADDDGTLQGTAVVIVGNILHNALRVSVTLVVTVIHALAILVNRETFSRLVGVVHVMAGGGRSCLGEDVMPTNGRTVRKGERVGIALHLGGSVPLGLYLRVHGMGADLGLLGCFLSGHALLLLQLCHSFIVQFGITFPLCCFLLLTHRTLAVIHEGVDALPGIQVLLGCTHLGIILLHGGIVVGIGLLLCLDHRHRRTFEGRCFLGRLFLLQRIECLLRLLHLRIDNGGGVGLIASCHLV